MKPIECDECGTVLKGICIAVIDHDNTIYYFCNKQCSDEYMNNISNNF